MRMTKRTIFLPEDEDDEEEEEEEEFDPWAIREKDGQERTPQEEEYDRLFVKLLGIEILGIASPAAVEDKIEVEIEGSEAKEVVVKGIEVKEEVKA